MIKIEWKIQNKFKTEWKILKSDQNWRKNAKKKWSKLNEKYQKLIKIEWKIQKQFKTEWKILKNDQNWGKNAKKWSKLNEKFKKKNLQPEKNGEKFTKLQKLISKILNSIKKKHFHSVSIWFSDPTGKWQCDAPKK